MVGARTLLGAPGHTTRSKKLLGLLGAKGIGTSPVGILMDPIPWTILDHCLIIPARFQGISKGLLGPGSLHGLNLEQELLQMFRDRTLIQS